MRTSKLSRPCAAAAAERRGRLSLISRHWSSALSNVGPSHPSRRNLFGDDEQDKQTKNGGRRVISAARARIATPAVCASAARVRTQTHCTMHKTKCCRPHPRHVQPRVDSVDRQAQSRYSTTFSHLSATLRGYRRVYHPGPERVAEVPVEYPPPPTPTPKCCTWSLELTVGVSLHAQRKIHRNVALEAWH